MANDNEDPEALLDQPSHAGLNRAEGRVLDKLVRARTVARLLQPSQEPKLEDLIELAEMITDEGG